MTDKQTADSQIASTIFAQLGGQRFVAMTGARSISRDGSTLIVKLPCTRGLRGYGFNVTLNAFDTYNVKFFRMKRDWTITEREIENVYFDQLREVIERETGLRLSL